MCLGSLRCDFESVVFQPPSDLAVFSLVSVQYDAVTWTKGLDLAPDAMHDELQRNGEWRLR